MEPAPGSREPGVSLKCGKHTEDEEGGRPVVVRGCACLFLLLIRRLLDGCADSEPCDRTAISPSGKRLRSAPFKRTTAAQAPIFNIYQSGTDRCPKEEAGNEFQEDHFVFAKI